MTAVIFRETATRVGGVTVPGRFCLPPGHGPFPAVIVLHGSDGIKPNHLAIAEKLASSGMAAFAPTWFGGDPDRPHWDHLRPDDIPAAVTDFQQQANVAAGRLGFMGFSRGGGLALFLASLFSETKAVVNYFGLTSWQGGLGELPHLPLNQNDHLDFIRHLTCPILSFHGDADTVVPVTNTYLLNEACRRYSVPHEFVIYSGVNHSFIWDDVDNDKYDRRAHLDSWGRAMRFFKQQLE